MKAMVYDGIVIGAGPAGMMAAGTAGRRGKRILLLDKNPAPGRKLGITGKGRCNLTNLCEVSEMFCEIPCGGKFLLGALNRFSARDTMEFFEGLGVPLKVERGRRVFPVSDKAGDIVSALTGFALHENVEFMRSQVLGIKKENLFLVSTVGGDFLSRSLLISTGGMSYPATGSTGDGYRFAKALGHSIEPVSPSLVPLESADGTCGRLQGLSLRNCGVKVTAGNEKKPVYEDFGELLFTHFGLSGPVVLSASAHLRPMEPGKFKLHIDLKPALSREKLDLRLLRDLTENRNRILSNSLDALLPKRLIPEVISKSGVSGEKRCNSLTREERGALLNILKDFTVEISGFRPIEEAVITSGGVSLKEIDPRTMESKIVPGLFFAGEVMDADAYTGGYNLQIAFSTGRLAGENL